MSDELVIFEEKPQAKYMIGRLAASVVGRG